MADLLPLSDPVLLEPRREHRVAGRDVTFRWEPVEDAQAYTLQVALDTAFSHLVAEEDIGAETSLRLENVFPEDRQTYYWRVLARRGDEEGPGEHIESFITLSPEELQLDPETDSGEKETYGPAVELFHAAGVEAAAQVSEKARLEEESAHLGVEEEGVEAGQIIGLTLAVLVAIGIVIVLLFQWQGRTYQAVSLGVSSTSGYPALREAEATATREIGPGAYEVLDDAQGVYRIPVDRAISIMSNEAVSNRDTTGAGERVNLYAR